MPQESQLAHRNISNPGALPYISNTSPTVTDSYLASGSTDLMTSIAGYIERRPGFANNVETTPTTFHNLQRLFTWDRFDGSFYVMACQINSLGKAVVYKMFVGVDSSFIAIYTEATPSMTPYDFVVSNNTIYFSNGFYAKKWDPNNGVSNWGISSGSLATGSSTSPVSKYCSTATDIGLDIIGGSNPWTNPSNITGAPNTAYATATLTPGVWPGYLSNVLYCTNYGFGIPTANTITGITVTVTGHISNGSDIVGISAQLLVGGSPTGDVRVVNTNSTGDINIVFGDPNAPDLWSSTWSPANVNDSSFGVALWGQANLTLETISLDAAQITVFSSGILPISVSGSAGTMSATVGYQYVSTYGNSKTGHISSPSAPSPSTGPFINKLKVSIGIVASSDPQVNQIHLYRTTDSASGLGGQSYFEIPNSPFPNTTATVDDAAPDTALNIASIAPIPTFNDPPPSMQGMVYFSGRIWGFTGNKVWFSGLEEITVGVPEESFPSGIAGNFWTFDQPVQGLGLAGINDNQVLIVFCGGKIYAMSGNTLDTFRRFQVSNRRGSRNLACVSMLGGMCAWLDSANQIWATDGTSLEELSKDIRLDLAGVNTANCCLTFHAAGRFHWLLFSTGTKIFVYDIDQETWMPPWTFACQYLFSGETSPGAYQLMAATTTKALQLSTSTYKDNGSTYQPVMVTGLFSLVPDFGKRFSYIGVGSYDEPSRTGVPFYVQMDTNNIALSDVAFECDDDPTTAAYSSIFLQKKPVETTFMRKNGVNINQQIFPMSQPTSRWMSVKVTLQNADQLDKIYGLFVAYKEQG